VTHLFSVADPGRSGQNTRMRDVLTVCEIFRGIMGESSYAGLPGAIVRLSGCDVGCRWCDTRYAFERPGRIMELETIRQDIYDMGVDLVLITGGEPLLQDDMPKFAKLLAGAGHTVLVETSGTRDISVLPVPIIRVMDVKCPSSGVTHRMNWYNLPHLRANDEVKFVIANREDYEWARDVIEKHNIPALCRILMGPVWGQLAPGMLADWILFDNLPVRLQVQLHKIAWPDQRR